MGIPLLVILLVAAFWPQRDKSGDDEIPDDDEMLALEQADVDSPVVSPRLGAYPIPPMDLAVPVPPIRTPRSGLTAGGRPELPADTTTSAPTTEGASSVIS